MPEPSPHRIWTVPNLLSFSRLALVPVFLWLVAQPDRRYWIWAGALVGYGILSDVLDGILARKLGQVTEVGKLVDPLADKITTGVVALFCVAKRGLPLAALCLALARDLAIVAGGRFLWKKSRAVPTSAPIGKVAAFSWGVDLLLWVFDLQPVARWVLWPVVILYLVAGVVYARRVLKES